MTNGENTFSSIRYPFGIDTGNGQLAEEPDYEAHVAQLIRQVLLTSPGERVNRPDFGCGLRRLLFAPNSVVSATLTQVTIVEALQRWLSSVIQVNEVSVEARENILEVKIAYTLLTNREKRYLNMEVAP